MFTRHKCTYDPVLAVGKVPLFMHLVTIEKIQILM